MKAAKLVSVLICWAGLLSASATAQSSVFRTVVDYLENFNRTGANLGHGCSEWTSERGELNGDGFEDMAMILSCSDAVSDGGTQLVVLAGRAEGGYAVLSKSARYCNAHKFFNLRIEEGSFYAEAVQKADSTYFGSNTLQFRFNKRLGDFEVIGQELRWDSYDDESSGSWSKNFLTGAVVESEVVRGRTIHSKRAKEQRSPLMRLNGFDCNNLA